MARLKKDILKSNEEKKPKILTSKNYIFAVGRRKSAVARVRIYNEDLIDPIIWGKEQIEKGSILVNQQPIGMYFNSPFAKAVYEEPLRITNTLGKYMITVKVEGGGKKGQLDALLHGIARALNKINVEEFRPVLKKKGFLTRDSRIRERRKVGTGGKARRKKQSPKR